MSTILKAIHDYFQFTFSVWIKRVKIVDIIIIAVILWFFYLIRITGNNGGVTQALLSLIIALGIVISSIGVGYFTLRYLKHRKKEKETKVREKKDEKKKTEIPQKSKKTTDYGGFYFWTILIVTGIAILIFYRMGFFLPIIEYTKGIIDSISGITYIIIILITMYGAGYIITYLLLVRDDGWVGVIVIIIGLLLWFFYP